MNQIRMFLLCLFIAMMPGCGCGKRAAEEIGEHHEDAGVVHLKQESQKMIGLELVSVEKKPLQSVLEVVGEIAQETENVIHVTSPEPGILKTLMPKLGEVVEKGTPLCVIQTKTVPALEIPSPIHGIVLAQYLKMGDAVDSLTSIMTIANPDLLRASFNVYEKDLSGIKMGQKVSVKSIAYPSKAFEGEIVFISLSVDEKTRTIKIRVDVKNDDHLLKFGMFVTGQINIPMSEPVLTLPESALQNIKGKLTAFIPKEDVPGEFLMKEVRVGRTVDEQVEILDGLSENEKVVGKGSFYLKSELLKSELEEHD